MIVIVIVIVKGKVGKSGEEVGAGGSDGKEMI